MANWAFANCSSFVISAVGAAEHLYLGQLDCSGAIVSTSFALSILGFVLLGYTCLDQCLKNLNW